MKRISSHATNVARIILEQRKEKEEEATLKAKLSKIEKRKKSEMDAEKEVNNDNYSNLEKH